ncbi:MAG: addiction module protein [Pirellulaceae bacterium]
MSTETITSAALALPPDSRFELAETLLHSLDPSEQVGVTKAWKKEIARRIAAFEKGEMKTYSEAEVTRDVRRRRKS